jgi:hypothetical protein
MSENTKISPQEWLDWQLRNLDGYKDLDELQSCLISSYAKIESSRQLIQKYTSSEFAGRYTREDVKRNEKRIAWAFELKTLIEKEIADFPPLPVLPPRGPLEKISGVIEEVTFIKAMACFEAEAYSTMRDELERKRNRDNAGAAIAMIAQTLSGTAPHALINDGNANKLKCLYVKGKIGGKSFSGWFGMTNIQVGDYIEMVVLPNDGNHIAYAIVNTDERTVSLTPKCSRDGRLYSLPLSMAGSFLFMFLPFFIFGIFASNFRLWVLFWFFMFSTVFGIYMYKTNKRDFGPSCDLFKRIQYAFDSKQSWEFSKAAKEKKETNSYPPRTEGGRKMPQPGGEYAREFFYFY